MRKQGESTHFHASLASLKEEGEGRKGKVG